MSRIYNTVKRYYDEGIYSKEDVARFVLAGKLTGDEYRSITGDGYDG